MGVRPCKDIPEFDHLKFLSKIKINQDTECWEWCGAVHPLKHYGQHSVGLSNNFKAHRLSYELFIGGLSSDNVIDHMCKNRICVNPYHLRQVSWRINTLENSEGEAAKNLRKDKCNRGHFYPDKLVPHRDGWKRFCPECSKIRTREYLKRKKLRG